jgi:hypothetical protein
VPEDPKKKAQSILDSLPGSSLVSKTAILSAGAGLSIAAISNELYVVNEETVVAFCLLSVFFAVGKYGGPMYKEWAQGQIQKQKDILNSARADHTNAVKQRIEDVKQLGGVVDITRALFEVSKVGANSFGEGTTTDDSIRKLRNWRLQRLSWNKRQHSLMKPNRFSIHGSGTKDKLRYASKENWPTLSSAKSRRSSKTQKPCSKSYNKVWRMLRVSILLISNFYFR